MAQVTEAEYRRLYPEKLRIYDVGIDEYRDATQRDIELLMNAASNWASIREGITALYDTARAQHEKSIEKARNILGH